MSNTPTHGSDVQETPDWWKASDGRFYPPELHPDYVKPVDPAPAVSDPPVSAPPVSAPAESPAAESTPSLAERLRAEADRVGDEASAAADAGVGSMGGVSDALGGVADGVTGAAGGAVAGAAAVATGAAAGVAASASDAVPDGMPLSADAVDPRATIPQLPAVTSSETIVQPANTPPSIPSPGAPPSVAPSMPSPGAPPAMPPSMPPSMPPTPAVAPSMPAPSAPPGMPPAPGSPPGMPPAPGAAPGLPSPGAAPPSAHQGPGGITYTAPAEPAVGGSFGAAPPGAMPPTTAPVSPGMDFVPPAGVAPAKASSPVAGFIAILAGAAAIAGSLLQWGKGAVVGTNGIEKAIIEVPGFDSSGLITAIAGGVLILAGLLFFMGVPKQLNWAILAFLGGAVIVGAVVFSMIDIGDLSNRYAVQWQAEGLASTGDVISTSADIGLWITGAGGVLGVLAAPFVKRS